MVYLSWPSISEIAVLNCTCLAYISADDYFSEESYALLEFKRRGRLIRAAETNELPIEFFSTDHRVVVCRTQMVVGSTKGFGELAD